MSEVQRLKSYRTFTADEAIEIAKQACAKAFDEMAVDDLLIEDEFNANMAIYIGAAFKEAAKLEPR